MFPVRTWIDQRAATDRARERLEVFERENELLASEKRDLSTDELAGQRDGVAHYVALAKAHAEALGGR